MRIFQTITEITNNSTECKSIYNIKQAESIIKTGKWKLKGPTQEESWAKAGGPPVLSPLRKNGCHWSEEGRLDCESSGQRKTKGDHWYWVHVDKMVLVVVRWGRLDCESSSHRKLMKAKKSQGGPPGSNSFKLDGSCGGQAGRLVCMNSGQRQPRENWL